MGGKSIIPDLIAPCREGRLLRGIHYRQGAIVVILVLAAALRVAHVLSVHDSVLLEPRGWLDDAYYYRLALEVASGGLMAGREAFFLSPLYIYFLGIVYALFPAGLIAPFLVQAGAGVAAVYIAYKCGQAAFGERAALVAAALLGLDGLVVMYAGSLLASSLDPLLFACFLLALLRADRKGGLRPWALAGLAAGLFALNRPNTLALIPIAALVPLWTHRRQGLPAAAAGIIAAALVIAPCALRNYLASGQLVLVSSHGGLNFYIGNRSGAPGFYLAPAWMDPDVRGQEEGARRRLEAELGRPLLPSQVSSILYSMTEKDIAAAPLAWLRLLAQKTLYALNARESALNLSLPYLRRALSPALRLAPVGMWLLLPLGFTGAMAARKQRPARIIVIVILAYGSTLVLFFVSDRYRLPLHVPLALLAGAGVDGIIRSFRARNTRELALLLAAFILALGISAPDVGVPSGEGQLRLEHALRLIAAGRLEEAHEVAAAMPRGAMNPFVWRLKLGQAFASAGKWDWAREQFSILTGLAPDSGPLRCEIGAVYLMGGKTDWALPELEAGAKLSPGDNVCGGNLERARRQEAH